VASFAIQSNATAADSGIALMCANTSFFGELCANAGARPVARMPAMPAPARNSVRRLNEKRLVGAGIGDPPKLVFFCLLAWPGMERPASPATSLTSL
jgi:hypothetical protein